MKQKKQNVFFLAFQKIELKIDNFLDGHNLSDTLFLYFRASKYGPF